uniref:Phospholipid scramblase n=1 Tax=Chromera velia CCMP2878 TaxID=1169474 RepID=A0A0G4F670_9ALVE|eukprot:Cvel_15345.t1-p1 / transcript=Cvel_15345.t1 / gene=Cvel_15345 / organism=Chromera_velia_CCMP2878 / gene_product=hypothetical protein / transcript_product=hypothetical protein / location=Cvel_scaffold1129:40268-45289(+) / protein_length=263 / sequence_SO=supercontig / SO=protein_coding / is_pseudo=false
MGPPAGAQPPPEGYAGQAPPPFVHPGTMPEPPQTQPLMQAQGYPPQPAQGYPPQPAQGYPPQPAQGYPQAEQVKQQHYPKGFHPGANGAPVPPGPGGPQVYAPPIMVMDPMTMLAQQERVYVKEKLRLIELLGIDAANKYVIRDTYKNNLFVAKETTGCCERNCIPNKSVSSSKATAANLDSAASVPVAHARRSSSLSQTSPRGYLWGRSRRVEFGHVQDPQWKALLVSAAIFMDFRLFNGADSQRNNENGAAVGGLIAASFR